MSANIRTPPSPPISTTVQRVQVLALGMESVGKSSLLAALSGRASEAAAYAGSTLRCRSYFEPAFEWVDTPGLQTALDTATTAESLRALESCDTILIFLRPDRAEEELRRLLPLIAERRAALVFTFRDLSANGGGTSAAEVERILAVWRQRTGLPAVWLNARTPALAELGSLRDAVSRAARPAVLGDALLPVFPARVGWFQLRLEAVLKFPPVSLALLFGPALLAVTQANALADALYNPLQNVLSGTLSLVEALPDPLSSMLGGNYGVIAMLPFLLLYALPTILIFSAILAVYKNTGLIDCMSVGLHRYLRPFGLGARDLVRVMMGFGCNVPAVVATRACSSCSRGACVSAISFGSACSYQLPASLAVFSAAGYPSLAAVYLLVLGLSTLIYLRCTRPAQIAFTPAESLMPKRNILHPPQFVAIRREVGETLRDFFSMALPVFVIICLVGGLMQWLGLLDWLTARVGPLMAVFRLPAESATALVLGSVRKDGLAIGLLDGDLGALKVPLGNPVEVLTIVYLASVLLPCLVTLFTVAREMGTRFALRMVGRQMAFAVAFTLCIAWGGALITNY